MTLELGDPKLNATYYADVALTTGCHSVYIVGDDASMTRTVYPTTTAFTILVGTGTCPDGKCRSLPRHAPARERLRKRRRRGRRRRRRKRRCG